MLGARRQTRTCLAAFSPRLPRFFLTFFLFCLCTNSGAMSECLLHYAMNFLRNLNVNNDFSIFGDHAFLILRSHD